MKFNKDIFFLRLSAFLCAAILILDLGVCLSAYKADPITVKTGEEFFFPEPSAEKSDDQEASAGAETQAVATAAPAAVAGEIQNRFISPYTAGTSYNNVFLKNSSGADVNIKELLAEEVGFKIEKNGAPQVLIVHSHATECFMTEDRDYYTTADLSRTADTSKNVVAVGEELSKKLNAAGIVTLHSDKLHDSPDYNCSYDNCAETVKEYLAEYPSIKIVLDMHRDAIGSAGSKVKVTAKINKKQAAQVMLVMGSGYQNYRENLKLAVRLQQTMEILYPGFARALSLVPYEYNQSLSPGSLLIEMGTDANTLEEVKYSAELLGDALISLCNSLG